MRRHRNRLSHLWKSADRLRDCGSGGGVALAAWLLPLTLLRLLVAAATPLAPDEAYYWVWSRALAPGYLDHPPMVALWIRAGTSVAGDGAFGVRLLSPLAGALGSILLIRTAEDLLPGRRAGAIAAALLNATLLFCVGAVTMTPDTPLLLFWTATLWALGRFHATGNGAWWLAAGVFAGLAMDSKYTGALLVPTALAWLAWVPGARPWLRRWQPWAGAAVALLLFAPVIAWNAANGWASFLRQGGRAADWTPARALQFLAELIGGQIGLATPLLAVLFGAGLLLAARQAWRREPAWSLLATFSLLPAAVFVQHAVGDRVQANWPAVIYPAAAIAAAGLLRFARWRRPALALGGAMTAVVYLQAVLAPLPLPASLDPTLRLLGGWPEFAWSVAETARVHGATFVAVANYGDAAELARILPPDLSVVGVEPRWALFGLPHARAAVDGRPGVLLARGDGAPDAAEWASVGTPAPIARVRAGLVAQRYTLYPVIGRAGPLPAVEMPRRQ